MLTRCGLDQVEGRGDGADANAGAGRGETTAQIASEGMNSGRLDNPGTQTQFHCVQVRPWRATASKIPSIVALPKIAISNERVRYVVANGSKVDPLAIVKRIIREVMSRYVTT